MGDTERKKGWGGKRRRGKNKPNETAGKRGDYKLDPIVRDSDAFFNYVRAQGIVPEDEWNQFVETLKRDLPSSFRIRRSLPERDALVDFLKRSYIEPLSQMAETVHTIENISFVPYAYSTEYSRAAIRATPLLYSLHRFLITETAAGSISRQEAVSMIPPLLLDVQPHHHVLDACASPGSKTMQIIEAMHENCSHPDGLLVANDIENSRCYLLVHQTLKRVPTANCLVTNHDAATLPAPLDASGNVRLYDRVLCDVICSGDGTFRKNMELWKNWNINKGNGLHKLQHSIARRCLELLEVGGLMVYSTCSLNPIEDEAIVAQMLRTFSGCVELVDVSAELPTLKRAPGVSKWKVFSNQGVEYLNKEAAANDKSIVPSMFPPTDNEANIFNLDRAFRILPHTQNTGGFFVAVLRKTAAFPQSLVVTPTKNLGRNPAKRRRYNYEQPFHFFSDATSKDLKSTLESAYGVDPAFEYKNLLVRSDTVEDYRNIYYVNAATRDFLTANLDRFYFINAGVTILKKVEKRGLCELRIAQDGLATLVRHIGSRIVNVGADDASKILLGDDEKHHVPLDTLAFRHELMGFQPGSIVLNIQTEAFSSYITSWLGANSIAAFITREEKIHLLNMLGRDASSLEKVPVQTSRRQQGTADAGKADGEAAAASEDFEAIDGAGDAVAELSAEDTETPAVDSSASMLDHKMAETPTDGAI